MSPCRAPRSWAPLFCCLAAVAIGPTLAQDDAERVGELGRADRLVIRGLESFDTEQLRRPLLDESSLLPFAAPHGARAEYVQRCARLAEQILRHAGFATATVVPTVETIDGTAALVLTVTEGPRVEAGKVVIHGLPDDVAARIAERLRSRNPTEPARPEEARQADGSTRTVWRDADGRMATVGPVLWPRSGPAPCDDVTLEDMRWLVRMLLADEGYLDIAPPRNPGDPPRLASSRTELVDAGIEVAVDPGDGREATLTITVAALPPRAWITRIELPRRATTTPEEMASFLGIVVGGPVTRRDGLEWAHRLGESGRFVRHGVSIDPDLLEPGGWIVRFDIVEYGPMMPLSRPLSREEETVLRCRRWLLDSFQEDHELVFIHEPLNEPSREEGPGLAATSENGPLRSDGTTEAEGGAAAPRPAIVPRCRLTLSNTRGIAIEVEGPEGEWHGMVATADKLRFVAPRGAGWLDVPLSKSVWNGVCLELSVLESKTADLRQRRDDVTFQVNLTIENHKQFVGSGGTHAQPSVSAVFCSVLLHQDSPQVCWEGDDLVIRRKRQAETRIDGKTGRPRMIGFVDRRATFEERPDALAEVDRRAESAGRSRLRADRPLSSAIRFLFAEGGLETVRAVGSPWLLRGKAVGYFDRFVDQIARIARQLDDDDALGAIDGVVWRRFAGCANVAAEPDLVVPFPRWNPGADSRVLGPWFSILAWRAAEQRFSPDSWEMILVRAAANAMANQRVPYHEMELFLASEAPGTAACALAARFCGDTKLAATVARHGIEHATVERFLADCRPLLLATADVDLAGVVRGIVRGIDDESLGLIARSMAADPDTTMAVARRLRDSDLATTADMEAILAAAWEAGLRETLLEHLRQLAAADSGRTVNGLTSTVTITNDGVTRTFTSENASATVSPDGKSFSFEAK